MLSLNRELFGLLVAPLQAFASDVSEAPLPKGPSDQWLRSARHSSRQLAQSSSHPELGSAKLILLGFSGTGSLVGRLAEFAPDRMLAVIPTAPGHFDPLGMDTISLSPKALAGC